MPPKKEKLAGRIFIRKFGKLFHLQEFLLLQAILCNCMPHTLHNPFSKSCECSARSQKWAFNWRMNVKIFLENVRNIAISTQSTSLTKVLFRKQNLKYLIWGWHDTKWFYIFDIFCHLRCNIFCLTVFTIPLTLWRKKVNQVQKSDIFWL